MRFDLEKLTNYASLVAAASAVAVALLVGQQWLTSAPRIPTEPREISEWRGLAEAGRRLGAENAPVTIIEFGDYECPACRSFQPTIEEILRNYPDDVAFVYRHWPLTYHQQAYPAARAAECAGDQGVFWEFHRQLFEDTNWFGDAMTRFAMLARVNDLDKFGLCLGDNTPVPAIEAGIAAAVEIGAAGTPAIIVNGLLLPSVPDKQTLEELIRKRR